MKKYKSSTLPIYIFNSLGVSMTEKYKFTFLFDTVKSETYTKRGFINFQPNFNKNNIWEFFPVYKSL